VLRETLRGVPVSILMDPAPAVAEAGLTVQDFVFEHVLERGHRALPIVTDGALVGIFGALRHQVGETPVFCSALFTFGQPAFTWPATVRGNRDGGKWPS
jgi:hypothetical protein